MEKINKKGYLYFHQGWTDIVNQLSLITYYSHRYKNICCIMRKDAKPLVDFYINFLDNVEMIYSDYIAVNNCSFDVKILEEPDVEILFHGLFDVYRNNFTQLCNDSPKFFVNRFYECYGIDYIERVNSFNIKRDTNLENDLYSNFIKNHGENYVLYHLSDKTENNTPIDPNLSNLMRRVADLDYSVNLNGVSNVFFDYIKILENSKEIHLMDSVWASIIYQLDSKYGIFKHIPITVYCLRGYQDMFTQPIKLNNWTVL